MYNAHKYLYYTFDAHMVHIQGFGRPMRLNSHFTYIHCVKSVQEIQENTDQKKLRIWTLFSQ